MKRIIVSVTNDLTTDQRVDKVCSSLQKLSFDVLLVGRFLENSLPIKKKYKTKRFSLIFNKGFLFYAEYNIRLFFFLFFSKKDILLSNDLDTLLPNFLISKIQQKKLVYDSHELFTEIPELINRNFIKKVWLKIESLIFPKLKNVYTVNSTISKIYTEKYGVNVKIIKNYPVFKEIEKGKFPFDISNKKVVFYQGAINVGRGLELLIETIKILENYILIIAGDGDILSELELQVKKENLHHKVKFLGKIKPENLHQLTTLANIGCSLEEDLGLNYRYALPNKIFDYIQAEIPFITSNLPEMKQIVLDYKVGEILEKRDPETLANIIKRVTQNDYSANLKSAKKILTWQSEEKKLFAIFNLLK